MKDIVRKSATVTLTNCNKSGIQFKVAVLDQQKKMSCHRHNEEEVE